MNKRKVIIFIVAFVLISIVLSVFSYSLIKDIDVLIVEDSSDLNHVLLFAVLSILQVLFPIVPGEPVELLGGYLFGEINGTIICLICESIGSIIVILLVRKLKQKITNLYYNEKAMNKLEKLKQKKYFYLFSLLYMLPGTPKDLLCYFAGIAGYDLIPTLLVVTIGRIPAIVTSTLAAGFLKDKKIIVSIVIYLITALICIIDLFIYKKVLERKEKN